MLLSASVNSISSIPSPVDSESYWLNLFRNTSFAMLLTCVPMQESFPAEHCCELLRDPLEDFLENVFKQDLTTVDTWIAVELPIKVAAMGRPRGGTSQTATFFSKFHKSHIFPTKFHVISFNIASIENVWSQHLDIVWNPLNKVGRILVLHCQHLNKYHNEWAPKPCIKLNTNIF